MASDRLAMFKLLCALVLCMVNLKGAQGETLHTQTFKSPGFVLGPGDVIDRYLPVNMPRGHIAVRSLDMTVVDSAGSQVPLSETYLHHWALLRHYIDPTSTDNVGFQTGQAPNDGVCNPSLVQWFGLGSEFRHTNTTVPAPYGIVFGNPDDVPKGQVEVWFLNVHAIDTRGVVDAQGCTECLCNVYNVTVDGYGRDLPAGYEGGALCCHDQTRCPIRSGFEEVRRELFLEFVIRYVDYSDAVVPVKVYLLDVTDKRTAWNKPAQCMVEYTVPKCAVGAKECVHTKEAVAFLPEGGYVVFSTAHLHSGGIVASLSHENGKDICVSHPIYGQGENQAGNETGYVVGMTSCHPDPKSIYIRPREKLHFMASYNNEERHTGVMGILLLLVADGPPPRSFGKGLPMLVLVLGTLSIIAAAIIGARRVYKWRNERTGGFNYEMVEL